MIIKGAFTVHRLLYVIVEHKTRQKEGFWGCCFECSENDPLFYFEPAQPMLHQPLSGHPIKMPPFSSDVSEGRQQVVKNEHPYL
jgi:hypothetical protein